MSSRADEIRAAVREQMRHQKAVDVIVERWSKEMNAASKACKSDEDKDVLRKDYIYAIFNIMFSLIGEPKSNDDFDALRSFFELFLAITTGRKVKIEIH